MDQQQHDDDPHLSGTPYAFYQHEDSQYPALPYAPTSHLPAPYQLTQPPDMLQMRQLSLVPQHHHQHQPFHANPYPPAPTSPTRVAASLQLPPSPSPVEYDHPISPPVSGSDTSNDYPPRAFSRESSSGAGSPPTAMRLAHRRQLRYDPTASAPARRGAGGRASDEFSDDGEGDLGGGGGGGGVAGGVSSQHMAETLANSRKEATRRQRIEAEQRRRDELREGYARLKDVLPLSNQKSSKVSLLERATNYIANLDQSSKILHARLAQLETEVSRLREINERLSLTVAHHTGQMPSEADLGLPPRPLSPPPDVLPHVAAAHTHAHGQGQGAVAEMYHPHHQRTDSSASGSQASGSEY